MKRRYIGLLLAAVMVLCAGGCVYYLGGDDTSLAALTIQEGEIEFSFDPDVTTYTIQVPEDYDSVTVQATPADENAVVSGIGTHDLIGDLTVVTLLVEMYERVYNEYGEEDRRFTTEYTLLFSKGSENSLDGSGMDPDEYESDDTPETASIYGDESQQHTIHSRTDVDYIAVEMVDYLTYTIMLESIDGFYPELALIQDDTVLESVTPFLDSWNEQLTYTPEAAGTLYVRVKSTYQAELFASYTLTIGTEVIPMEVPAGLTATDDEYDDRIVLQWDATTDAMYYEVYRSTNGTDFTFLGTSESASYEDISSPENGLSSGTTYAYKVRGVKNEEAKSEFSDPDDGSIAGLGVISDLTATVVNGTIRLSWTLLADEAVAYTIYAAEGAEGEYEPIGTESDPLTDPNTGMALYDVESAQPEIEYRFKIVPEKSGATGEDSNTAGATIPFASYKPIAPNATNSVVEQIRVTWEAVDGATGYELYRADEGMQNPILLGEFTVGETSHTDTDITVGVYYNYAIVAVKDGTTSDMSYYDNGIAVSQ